MLLSLDAFDEGVPKSFRRFMAGPRDGVPVTKLSSLERNQHTMLTLLIMGGVHAKDISRGGISRCRVRASLLGALHVRLSSRLAFKSILEVLFEIPGSLVVHVGIWTHFEAVGFPFEKELLRAERVDSKDGFQFTEHIAFELCVGYCEKLIQLRRRVVHCGVDRGLFM